jgi:4-carboxymuconolactone decarboxylase
LNKDQYKQGIAIRREVMGDEHVDRTLQNTSEFSEVMQDLATANCWGEVWDREGLSKQTRSLITISMLTALKATNELKGHVRGALRNGCSKKEIQEVLLHAAVYCGMPAGIAAFRAADEVISAWDDE